MLKTYNLTDKEIEIINIGKKYFNEKTEVEALKKMLSSFIRMHNLPSTCRSLSGMYGEMPTVRIGDIEIRQMTDKEGETRIWFDAAYVKGMGEGMEIEGKTIEKDLIDVFNKYF